MTKINPVNADLFKQQKVHKVNKKQEEDNQVQGQPPVQEQQPVQQAQPAANDEQKAPTLQDVLALVQQIEREPDAQKRAQLATQAGQMIDQLKAQLAPAEGEEAAPAAEEAKGNGKGKALGKDNRINHLAEKIEDGKKIANGHLKQLEKLSQSGSTELMIKILDALKARIDEAKDKDPGMKALEIAANNNKLALEAKKPIQQQEGAVQQPEEAAAAA